MADGELINDEFGWTEDPEFFTEQEFSTLVIEERWTLAERVTRWLPPPTCCWCNGDVTPPTDWNGEDVLLCSDDCRIAWDA